DLVKDRVDDLFDIALIEMRIFFSDTLDEFGLYHLRPQPLAGYSHDVERRGDIRATTRHGHPAKPIPDRQAEPYRPKWQLDPEAARRRANPLLRPTPQLL